MSQFSSQPRYFLGLDLGQAADFTAVSVLERSKTEPQEPRPFGTMYTSAPGPTQWRYQVRHLERYPLGTSYTSVAANVCALLKRRPPADPMGRPPLARCTLAVDQTGVGRPVLDMLRDALRAAGATVTLRPILITAGYQVTSGDDGSVHIPKKELVSLMQVLLQSRRFQVAEELPEAATLVKELVGFQVRITVAANESFGAWREGAHDDLVLSVAMAAWAGENDQAGESYPPVSLGGGWRNW